MAKKRAKRKKSSGVSDLLIKCYGLFWRKEDIFWGSPGKSGKLQGILSTKKKSDAVDFREQTGIYVLYSDYKIVYIGQAGNGNAKLFKRLKDHLNDDLSERWDRFSWYGLQWVKKTDNSLAKTNDGVHLGMHVILNHIEAILLHSSEPPLNRQGGRWTKKVEQYIQYRDIVSLGDDQETMIKKMHDQIFG